MDFAVLQASLQDAGWTEADCASESERGITLVDCEAVRDLAMKLLHARVDASPLCQVGQQLGFLGRQSLYAPQTGRGSSVEVGYGMAQI